jgi:ATP-binding cassette subfamily F protein 3
MLQLLRIGRHFGPQVLFEGLDWRIPAGARLGLVGPNGVGKTSLLRLMAALDAPDAGDVLRPTGFRVGYLAQEVETVSDGPVLEVVLGGFREIVDLERAIESAGEEMASLPPGSPELARATERYGALRHRYEELGGDRVEARARAILSGLGVPATDLRRALVELSGGWRMRVALARLLLGRPDLLLLDEPTNHLDLDALRWLEGFLADYDGAFVIVSHDRYFLNRLVSSIAELEAGRLTVYHGNYDEYLASKEAREVLREKTAREQARKLAQVERFIERFRYKASKAKQVQSRVKSLEKTERVAPRAKSVKRIRFGFPPAPRSGDIVVRAEGARKVFGDNVVYGGLDLLLRRGDRVALVGPNGAGKSTLMKLLAGRLHVDGGTLELGHNVAAAYYAQHQLEALEPQWTALEAVETVAGPGRREWLRSLLGRFLFSGDDVNKKIAVLSGGEKARLALARMLVHPANLYLMDEPTNHLDLKSREVLEDALNEYQGTLVLISHDRYFINRVATSVAEIGNGRAILHPGDYDSYLEDVARRAPSPVDAGVEEMASMRRQKKETRRAEAEERNRQYRVRRELEQRLGPVESEIARLEERLREITALQTDPEIYTDPVRAAEVARERSEAETRLQKLYAEWESLAEGSS